MIPTLPRFAHPVTKRPGICYLFSSITHPKSLGIINFYSSKPTPGNGIVFYPTDLITIYDGSVIGFKSVSVSIV